LSHIRDVIAHKKGQVLTIQKNATVFEAIKKMVERNVGSIIVLEHETIVGIFTERDYLRRIVLHGRTSKTTRINEVMSPYPICTDPDQSIEDCLNVMSNCRVRHVPVIEHGQICGIVSIGDLVKHLLNERSFENKNLVDYITGQYPGEIGPSLRNNY
jgi:CBS domain-containing protein